MPSSLPDDVIKLVIIAKYHIFINFEAVLCRDVSSVCHEILHGSWYILVLHACKILCWSDLRCARDTCTKLVIIAKYHIFINFEAVLCRDVSSVCHEILHGSWYILVLHACKILCWSDLRCARDTCTKLVIIAKYHILSTLKQYCAEMCRLFVTKFYTVVDTYWFYMHAKYYADSI